MLKPPPHPDQSLGEEIANSVSHGIGLLLAGVGAVLLIRHTLPPSHGAHFVGIGVFGLCMMAVYTTSMLYHAFPHHGRGKRFFLLLDHLAIYLLIAGTYTPFALGVLHAPWGSMLLGLVWAMALLGITLKIAYGPRALKFSTGLYVAMGWSGLLFAGPFYDALPAAGLEWILAGGAAYTLGVPFFLLEGRMRYSHLIWHLFVMAGTACHFVAVWQYAAG